MLKEASFDNKAKFIVLSNNMHPSVMYDNGQTQLL